MQKLETLLHAENGKEAERLLEELKLFSPFEEADLQALLMQHCVNSKTGMLPRGIEAETLKRLAVKVVVMPERNPRDRDLLPFVRALERALRLTPRVAVAKLERLGQGDDIVQAERNGHSHIPLLHASTLLYHEVHGHRIGTGGSVQLYWVAEHSSYTSGWLTNVQVEVICHASNQAAHHTSSGHQHVTMNGRVQVSEDGRTLALLPMPSEGDRYGVRFGLCICTSL